MSEQAKHSALPFKAEQTEPPSGFTSHYLLDANGKTVAAIDAKNGDANAAFIERACNSHEALLVALEAVQARVDGDWDNPALVAIGPQLASMSADVRFIVEAALKLAKGGK